MSEFDSNAREAQLTGQRMDEVRSNEWAERRADRDSLHNSLSDQTEHLDGPPEKIKLGEEPFDKFKRHGNPRRDIAEAMYEETFNAAGREKREQRNKEFDKYDKQIQRSHGVDALTGLKQMIQVDEALRDPRLEVRTAAIGHMVNLAHDESDYGRVTQQRALEGATKGVEEIFQRYEIAPTPEMAEQVNNLVYDHICSPGFRRTGDTDADYLRAVNDVLRGISRVKF